MSVFLFHHFVNSIVSSSSSSYIVSSLVHMFGFHIEFHFVHGAAIVNADDADQLIVIPQCCSLILLSCVVFLLWVFGIACLLHSLLLLNCPCCFIHDFFAVHSSLPRFAVHLFVPMAGALSTLTTLTLSLLFPLSCFIAFWFAFLSAVSLLCSLLFYWFVLWCFIAFLFAVTIMLRFDSHTFKDCCVTGWLPKSGPCKIERDQVEAGKYVS